jgi:hypothetical protein
MLANTAIGDLLERIAEIQEDAIWMSVAESDEAQEAVAEAQREQLRQGQRPDGSIFPDYSPTSVNVYGKPSGPIQWYDDGEFYDTIGYVATDKNLEFFDALTTGDDGQDINLEQQYDETILGIQTDNFTDINETFAAKYIEQLEILLAIR